MVNDYSVVLSAKLNEAQASAEITKSIKKIEKNASVHLDLGIKNDTLATNIEKAQLRVDNLRTKYSAFVKDPELHRGWQRLFDQSKIVESKEELTNLNAKIGVFEQQLEKAGKRSRSFGAELKNNVLKMGNWMLLGTVLATIIRSIGQIYTNVVAVNTAMTELKKVTNETATAYDEFLNTAADKAQNLSAKLSEMVEATSNFARLGFNLKDASQLAEVAIMYKNVGDEVESVDESTKSIISTMKAFGIQTSDTMSIIDIFNDTGNRYAVTSGAIGSAMQRAGAGLAIANNSLEESVALWTAMNEILQDGDVAATSLRFITARLRNTAGQLQEMDVDADGAAETITKLRSQILELADVDIMSTNDEFRSTYDVLKDIASIWDTLSGRDQADVIRLVAGAKQQTAFSALMTNWSTAEKVVETASNSMGSAAAEYEKWSESILAHSQSLASAWEEFSVNLLNSDSVVAVIDVVKLLVESLTFVEEHIGLLNIALVVLAGIAASKSVIGLNGLAFGLDKLLIKLGLTTGAATSLSMALSIMIPVAAIMGTIAIFNKVNVTLDEQRQKVADIQAEYASVEDELKDLNAIKVTSPYDTPLTENEIKRLEYLEKVKADLEYGVALEQRKEYKNEFFGEGDLFSSGTLGEAKGYATNRADTFAAWEDPDYEMRLKAWYSEEELQATYEQLMSELRLIEETRNALDAALQDPVVLSDDKLKSQIELGRSDVDGYIDAYTTAIARLVEVSDGSIETQDETLANIDAVTEKLPEATDETNKLLEAAQSANDVLEASAEAYDAVSDAVEEYNEGGYVADDTLASLEKALPGVISLLYDESGQLRDGASAAFESSDAMFAFLESVIQAQIAAAQTDYSNLVMQLGAASAAAVAAQQNIVDLQALLASITGAAAAGSKVKKSGGGGGSSSIYSKEYQSAKDYTEHMIKMSELRQKRMSEESASYESESQTQIAYYQQLMNSTSAELDRLTKKGYDESNKEFRQLAADYESYQNEIYDIAYNAWKQQQQAAIDAVEDQIDAENDRWEERKNHLDHEIDLQESLLTLEETYLDTIKDISKEIGELDKELATALTYPIGSDLALFTQDERDGLVDQLRDIEAEATSLYEDFQTKLKGISEEETWQLEGLTDEFERQYEILLKQYEISKADLGVARARRDLESVLNDRNVAMLVNGVWTWVADPESVKAAVEAVYDAEQEARDALTDLHNTQRTQALEEAISNLDMQRSAEEAAHDKIIDGLNDQIDAIQAMSFVFDDFLSAFMAGTEALKSVIDDIVHHPIDPPPEKRAQDYISTDKTIVSRVKDIASNRPTVKYAEGGVGDFTGLAHMDGSKSNSEVVFNSSSARKLYNLVYNTDDLVAMMASKISRAMNIKPSFGGGYGTPSGASNITNLYIEGVQIAGQDGDSFLTLLRRNVPLAQK